MGNLDYYPSKANKQGLVGLDVYFVLFCCFIFQRELQLQVLRELQYWRQQPELLFQRAVWPALLLEW